LEIEQLVAGVPATFALHPQAGLQQSQYREAQALVPPDTGAG
jgi:hypothetical protein